eukprot:238125_1
MESTHLRGESNQTNETLSFPNTYTSNEGTIRPTANAIVLNTFECNRIQSTAFHESTLNRCCRQELTKHAFVSITAIKKTNQGMMAMQRKVSGTCHVDQGRIKVRKERSQIFIATVSPPSATIITPSSIKPASVRSTPIKKETARRYSRQTSFLSELPSATCTPSLCLNCSVKFSAELKFFSNELKTHFSDEVVNGTDFTTKARHIAGNYTQNKDAVSFITNRLLVHAAEYESRLASIGVVVEGEWIDTMRNNSIGRKISSDSRTVSLSPITFIDSLQKDADAFNIAPPYRCYQGNGVHSSSLPPECAGTDGIMTRAIDEGEGTAQDEPDVDPLPQSVSNTHTKRKKHVEFRLNEGITPVSALFTKPCIEGKPSLFGIIAFICSICLFIYGFIGNKAFFLVFVASSFRPNSALSISAFSLHTCVLQTTMNSTGFNALKCFGTNDYGQCGYEHTTNIGDEPNEMAAFLPNIDTGIATIDEIKQVETGAYHTCILTHTGKAKCFGRNNFGQLGIGNNATKGNAPNTMSINLPFIDFGGSWVATQLAAGLEHTCALLSNVNGTAPNVIKCFGNGQYGGLGYGDTERRGNEANEMGDYLPPIDLGNGFDPIQIAVRFQSTCALSASNKIKCFGKNGHGQLGIGDTVNRGGNVGQMG